MNGCGESWWVWVGYGKERCENFKIISSLHPLSISIYQLSVWLSLAYMYCISLLIRQSFFSFQNNPKDLDFFSFQNNPKDLDPSCKTDLDLWDYLGRVQLVL